MQFKEEKQEREIPFFEGKKKGTAIAQVTCCAFKTVNNIIN